jgi:hypothetical protein
MTLQEQPGARASEEQERRPWGEETDVAGAQAVDGP